MSRKVRSGEIIKITPLADPDNSTKMEQNALQVAARNSELAALIKPTGLHCQALHGQEGPSLEAIISNTWPELNPIMLTRLDFSVSGLVLTAFGQEAAQYFRQLEEAGLVKKLYLAMAEGLVEEMLLDRATDSTNRKTVRVLANLQAEESRWTSIKPIKYFPQTKETLVEISIRKGSRHQIRAHMAACGHPLLGDSLYGRADQQGPLYLHHCRVSLPGFAAFCPAWFCPRHKPK